MTSIREAETPTFDSVMAFAYDECGKIVNYFVFKKSRLNVGNISCFAWLQHVDFFISPSHARHGSSVNLGLRRIT
jgi:hypothetical protein